MHFRRHEMGAVAWLSVLPGCVADCSRSDATLQLVSQGTSLQPRKQAHTMNDDSMSRDLGQFFGAYFHQDWDLEADDWPGLVDNYVDDTPHAARLRALAQEIDHLRGTRTGSDLEDLVSRKVDYLPESSNYDVWLGEVAHRLRQHADGIERNAASRGGTNRK
ncbi:hypothetical protein BH11ACT6_BH11ACT6_30130 [soil metagenome]